MKESIKNFIEEGEKELEEKCPTHLSYADCCIYRNDDDVKDFISSRQISLIKMIVEMVESEKKELPRNFDCGYTENRNYNQALDTISSKLKTLIK